MIYTEDYPSENNDKLVIPYNVNNRRQPELLTLNINPIFQIELNEGVLFINKLLDNIEIV